jgi:outer membrane protein OmpA-like peptidoglycan-associated protein
MTWRSTFITIALCLAGCASMAQTGSSQRKQPERRFMAELSSVFIDYQGPQTGNLTDVSGFNPGITMGAHANLGSRFDLSSGVSFVPELRYPLESGREVTTSLIDVNALIRFKFSSLYRKPDALFAPFIGLGVGINSGSNNVRSYLPLSAGLKLQLQENFAIMLQSTYKQGLGAGNIQHLAHTVGFVFGIPGTEMVEPIRIEEQDPAQKDSLMLAEIADADGDGVPDRDDLCIDKPGRAMYLGCPIDDTPTMTGPADQTPQVQDAVVEVKESNPFEYEQASDEGEDVIRVEPEPTQTEALEFKRISSEDLEIVRNAMDRIYFEPGSDRLTAESESVLDKVAQVLRRNPAYHLAVQGYADAVSDPDPSRTLPVTRAFAVKRYLCYRQDIQYARVYSDGKIHRDTRLSDFTSRPENRRVELDLIAPDHQAYRGE